VLRVARRATSVLIAAVCFAAADAHAACTSTATCLRAIDAAQAETRTLSARFVQTKHLSLLDEPLVSTGRFFFARPDRMRLEIETPHQSTIVINGRRVSIPGLQQRDSEALAASPMAAMFIELGALFTGSTKALDTRFAVEATSVGDGVDLTLTPTVPAWKDLFKTIELRFSGEPLTIGAMRLDDALGDRLAIEMRDVERNPTLPDSLFEGAPEAK
jgi:outer membrane lipoprotein-sorting protein